MCPLVQVDGALDGSGRILGALPKRTVEGIGREILQEQRRERDREKTNGSEKEEEETVKNRRTKTLEQKCTKIRYYKRVASFTACLLVSCLNHYTSIGLHTLAVL